MRAAVMRDWQLRVDDVADPEPGDGQVLCRVLACGICGSDLHMLEHGAEVREVASRLTADVPPDPMAPRTFEPHLDTVMGHEFCCEVVGVGRGVQHLAEGDVVVSLPVAFDADGLHAVGYSNRFSGGYADLIVLNEVLSTKVPAGVPATTAALTEPLAVGVHAVAKSRVAPGHAAVVVGAGPVGLACIAELRLKGIGPIIAADFSPARRRLAALMGADEVVDPRVESPLAAWRRLDGSRPLVIFEAVGVPGIIDQVMAAAPRHAQVLVVGACMQEDRIHPMLGVTKELSVQFAFGYEPHEFLAALTAIADGALDLAPWITGTVGIDGVPGAFRDLADPERHAKILVVPS